MTRECTFVVDIKCESTPARAVVIHETFSFTDFIDNELVFKIKRGKNESICSHCLFVLRERGVQMNKLELDSSQETVDNV